MRFLERLQPVRPDSGLQTEGYFVWGSTVVRVGREYHMFSSRWPERCDPTVSHIAILGAYIELSEIVHAVADNPEGPYRFREVVLSARGEGHWDYLCCHNPYMVRVGDEYVLYFHSRGVEREPRLLGYATASDVNGPWRVCDAPIELPFGACNPAVLVEHDGGVLLVFRRPGMRLAACRAPRYDGAYTVVNDDIMPGTALEDPCLLRADGEYHMLVEDNGGEITGDRRNGAHLVSDDGAHWRVFADEPKAYGHTIEWTDGTRTELERRERPFVLTEDGAPTHLVTGIMVQRRTRSIVQPLGRATLAR